MHRPFLIAILALAALPARGQEGCSFPKTFQILQSFAENVEARKRVGQISEIDCDLEVIHKGVRSYPRAAPVTIYKNDIVRCRGEGEAKIRLDDESQLTIGTRAEVKLDDYLVKGSGVGSTSRGVLRFMGGKLMRIKGESLAPPRNLNITNADAGLRG